MPIVTIQVTREDPVPAAILSHPRRKHAIAGVSQLSLDVLHKPLEATFVVIEEVELENRAAACQCPNTANGLPRAPGDRCRAAMAPRTCSPAGGLPLKLL